jgi:DNA polymerase III alpha subunit (gram-positive type)
VDISRSHDRLIQFFPELRNVGDDFFQRFFIPDELKLQKVSVFGEKLNKPVVATGNVHYLNDEDKIYRKILISSQGGANPLNRHVQIVFDRFDLIDHRSDFLRIVNHDFFRFFRTEEGESLQHFIMSYQRARSIYGEELPEIVEARIEKELKSIIGHGFAVIYLISHKPDLFIGSVNFRRVQIVFDRFDLIDHRSDFLRIVNHDLNIFPRRRQPVKQTRTA